MPRDHMLLDDTILRIAAIRRRTNQPFFLELADGPVTVATDERAWETFHKFPSLSAWLFETGRLMQVHSPTATFKYLDTLIFMPVSIEMTDISTGRTVYASPYDLRLVD